MKRIAPLFLFLLAACGSGPIPEQNPYAMRTDAAQAGGKLFRDHCAECHGSDAQGSKHAPPLRSAHVDARSDRALFAIITNGNLRRGMPSWSRIPEERRWQIVTYLRAINRSQVPAGGK